MFQAYCPVVDTISESNKFARSAAPLAPADAQGVLSEDSSQVTS